MKIAYPALGTRNPNTNGGTEGEMTKPVTQMLSLIPRLNICIEQERKS